MEAWVARAAEQFWSDAGGAVEGPACFPRDVEGAVALALPVMLVKIPRLGVFRAERWLVDHGCCSTLAVPDRRLRACLVAVEDQGYLLLDGCDAADEQRYSIAHEAAHFILDYLQPRQRVVRRLGASALAVLDGRRAAEATERLDAVLADVPLGMHVHTLDREAGGLMDAPIARSERRADRLALELLAPERAAVKQLPAGGRRTDRRNEAASTFAKRFGLPHAVALAYARRLLDARDGPPGLGEWLSGEG